MRPYKRKIPEIRDYSLSIFTDSSIDTSFNFLSIVLVFLDAVSIVDEISSNFLLVLSKISPNLIMAIPMSYDVETKLADKIVDKIIKRAEKEITTLTSNIELWGIDKFNVSHIDYKIQVPVKMDEQYAAKRKINRIIKEEYEKANIPVPYNIIEVKNGQRI